MSKTYTVQKTIIHQLFKKGFNNNSFLEEGNGDYILDILIKELPEHSMENIVHLMVLDHKYEPLKIGDYVKLNPISYHAGTEYEIDVMRDMGLMHADGDIFAEVLADNSWRDGEFNPFYSQIKLNLMYHDADKDLKFYEHNVNPMALTRHHKGHIKYFKSKNKANAKDINRTPTD